MASFKPAPDPATLDLLRAQWINLYAHQLPTLAASRSPVQSRWPVYLDHCFARIILDNAIGINVPWTAKVKAPAVKNMSSEQLELCIKLAHDIAEGREDLVMLDRRSLEIRGKAGKGGKRALEGGEGELPRKMAKREQETPIEAQKGSGVELVDKATEVNSGKDRPRQMDIRALMSGVKTHDPDHGVSSGLAHLPPSDSAKSEEDKVQQPTNVDEDITRLITTSGDLTPFRKKVLLLLTQVPPSRYTTYAAMSAFLKSSPRAIGNAMRNNPFAPTVPCHRVLAANGGIGGFGGDWGAEGKHAKEKIRLLRDEGVRFDGRGKVNFNLELLEQRTKFHFNNIPSRLKHSAAPTPAGPVINPGNADYTFMSCYGDGVTKAINTNIEYANNSMAVQICLDFCKSKGQPMAALDIDVNAIAATL